MNIFALRQREYLALEILAINLQPARSILMRGEFLRLFQQSQLAAVLADGNLFSHTHLIGRNVDLAAIDCDVPVTHKLPRLPARHSQANPVHHRIQTAFQLLQQKFAGYALGARSLLEIVTELAFLRKVHALGLLLLAQLQAITNDFRFAVLAMLAGSKVTFLHRTLVGETFRAFEEQLHALAAA